MKRALVVIALCACRTAEDPIEARLVDIEQQETSLRASTDWATFRSRDGALGPDPVDIVALGNDRFATALRGANAVAIVDANGKELSIIPADRPEAVVVGESGDPTGTRERVRRLGRWSAELDVIGHRVRVSLAGRPIVDLTSDGPPLGVALMEAGNDVLVAYGLLEDHPLDRTIGSFGYIDSFVRVDRVHQDGTHERVLEQNTSELGVVTPRALTFLDGNTLLVVGAGSGVALRANIKTRQMRTERVLPGIVAVAPTSRGFIGVSPLLDAWVIVDADGPRAVSVPALPSDRSIDSKLGEALVFTTIMAPRQKSEGPLSRFTCEACHFDGDVDGRIHHTGRGDIVATTRPLGGLFNNKPLFTRALDPNIARMVHAEFRVASSNSTLDPWFSLTLADAPWLPLLGVTQTQRPEDLRRALMTFLRDFTPRENASAVSRTSFTDEERSGAIAFQKRCVSCHAARLVGDDPKTEVPFASWENLIFSQAGPIVWSSPERRRTGIEPYVHEDGARSSSLRRLERKQPYFTNGTSKTIADVLGRARIGDGMFLHASTTQELAPLSDEEKRALLSFLLLL